MGLRALQRRRHEVSADAAHIALFSSSLEKIILEILESPMNPAIYNSTLCASSCALVVRGEASRGVRRAIEEVRIGRSPSLPSSFSLSLCLSLYGRECLGVWRRLLLCAVMRCVCFVLGALPCGRERRA